MRFVMFAAAAALIVAACNMFSEGGFTLRFGGSPMSHASAHVAIAR